MDPTAQFFSKLKKLAVTLEAETAELQQTFENRNDDDDDDDSENTAKAMRAYHELNGEVGDLKGQIQDQLAQQKTRASEVSGFIDACRVMQQKVTKDSHALRGHWEKYGYRAPRDTQRPNKNKGQESENEDEAAGENETKSAEKDEEGSQEEAGDGCASSPVGLPPPVIDALRTPQLSDFGLSEMQLKRTLAGAEWCAEVPPMPEMSLPHPALNTPAPPPMPLTPKCALRMSDDDLQTPQMHDFGITEHTMCLNNDFTMDLLRKNIEKPQRPSLDEPVPPAESLKEGLFKKAADLESPEPPVFCTPGLKIKKTNSHRSPAEQGSGDPESPGLRGHLHTTPEAPTFQTPYVNRLVSTKKSAQPHEPVDMQDDDDDDGHALKLPTRNGATGSKRTWEYDLPELSFTSAEDKPMPEMPNLESVLGNSLQNRSAKIPKKTSAYEKVTKGPTVHSLELDGPTQEFSLGTPRIRMDYQDPSTPEMPDLSSVTQDICKLVSQAQLKKTEVAVVQPNVRPKTIKNSSVSLSVVSESEFQSLPSYLRQMTLSNLNQAVHSINQFTAEFEGEKTELQMEELRRITKVGTKTPVYILCLTELKRLEHVRGARNTSVYKLSTRN
ncbi:spindle and kinetochore-associated protein 3 isoform X2 [Scophthalmus maximus]|uniref:spindle and kinetochore-associated protein 3 isoform X2 n=1 Tax=Scophthalmus maximus TaxID=52904 RepID=UPI001FA86996|nr:spindle and kinetochore-associated protein 3 isoform X2 [Scophthalmus maximus]